MPKQRSLWLWRGKRYLHDFISQGRLDAAVLLGVVNQLQNQRRAVAPRAAAGAARDAAYRWIDGAIAVRVFMRAGDRNRRSL
jgi:hypothetical protein